MTKKKTWAQKKYGDVAPINTNDVAEFIAWIEDTYRCSLLLNWTFTKGALALWVDALWRTTADPNPYIVRVSSNMSTVTAKTLEERLYSLMWDLYAAIESDMTRNKDLWALVSVPRGQFPGK